MTIDDENAPKESAVEVTLPEESVAEVELSEKTAKISEEQPKIETKQESAREEPQAPAVQEVDEREIALQQLKKQYEHQRRVAEAEREARKKAEEYARQQAQQVHTAQNDVQNSNLRIILNAIDATEQAAQAAERDYSDAMAAGDYTAAAKAQRMMAQAESHLLQLNNGRQKLEESLQSPTEGRVSEPEIPKFEPQIQPDPVEMYAERLTPKSADWLRRHPQVVDKIPRLTRAHQDALEDGIEPESADYFAYIEQRLGISSQPREEYREPVRETPREQAPPPRKSVASAPVSSSASGISSNSSRSANTMVLSPAEVEMAILAEPDLSRDKAIESYARNKAYLIKSGKLSA